MPWGWVSYGDYLDRLEGNVGINVGGIVGHIAVRQYVMGEESSERAATADEIAKDAPAGEASRFSAARWVSRPTATNGTCAKMACRFPAGWPTE